MKIFLVRHGETTGDIEGRYGGSYDDHLTPKGRKQLERTAQDLFEKNENIEVIFSSPLIRAKESAEIIQKYLNCDIEIVDNLRERHYGILTGLTKKEALEKYPKAVDDYKNPNNTVPEGESYQDFNERVLESWKLILKQKHWIAAVVSHGGSIKAILADLNMDVPENIGDGEIIELTSEDN